MTIAFSVATWNMNHWQGSALKREGGWQYLRDLGSDVALVQEAVVPTYVPHAVHRPEGIGSTRRWGSAVVSWSHPLTEVTKAKSIHHDSEVELLRTHHGTVAIADVEIDGAAPVTIVSVYGMVDEGYNITTVHRILTDLTPLFDSRRYKRIVLGGDLNSSSQLPRPHGKRHRNLFQRIEAFGLVDLVAMTADSRQRLTNCPCEDEVCAHVMTWRNHPKKVPMQDDYLFASAALADNIADVKVIDEQPGAWEFSDHCPVLATFEL